MIVAFTKDWSDLPTCTTHILRGLARDTPVLWIESIGTRRPHLRSARDWRRIGQRLSRVGTGPRWVEHRLWVWSPPLIPCAHGIGAVGWNRLIARRGILHWARRQPVSRLEYWCFIPTAEPLLPTRRAPRETGAASLFGAALCVYYCVDDWGQFSDLSVRRLEADEERLLQHADLVVAVSRRLESKCRAVAGDRVFYLPHGVHYAQFAAALHAETPLPDDLMSLPRPVAGFYGSIREWLDFELLEALADRLPSWTFVLIGPIYVDVRRLRMRPNIHFLGPRDHATLPSYCKGFDVAIIPYDCRHPRMASVNPVKTWELLAAGVPLVASPVPELQDGFGDGVRVCDGLDAWCVALAEQAARTDRHVLSAQARAHDWAERLRVLRGRLVQAAARRPPNNSPVRGQETPTP